ncbi:MAG: hypothetical protein LBR11_02255 [Deltaproteobacteria bacterium]|jgi:hypothetical protein|nr:hypothetical protein [Deltaproteobacteria bacterium]
MKHTLQLSDQTLELLKYFNDNNYVISDDCFELFDIASVFYYNYHIKEMPKFIGCAHFFVYFDRLIVHTSDRLEILFPGFKASLNDDNLGYLEKLDIIKNFIKQKLFISICLN